MVCKFYKQNVAGFLMEKEIDYLGRALANPERPFVAILGGAKVSDKVNVITNLLTKVNALIIGGAMAYTFYRAKGMPDRQVAGRGGQDRPGEGHPRPRRRRPSVKLLLPVDNVIADKFDAAAQTKVVGEKIDDGWMALDIGPKSAKLFAAEIRKAKTVVWNGPMGCFEMKPFAAGTLAVAKAIAETKCLSIIGGGDSVSAVNKSGLADQDDAHQHRRRREPRVPRRQGAARRGGADGQVRQCRSVSQ